MGTYGFVRIAMPMLPDAWRAWAWVVIAVGIVSVLWGALVAFAQTDLKRMIAYTSVNHMGYVVLAVGAAGVPVVLLLVVSVFIGVLPRTLLDVIEPAAAILADLVER